jgi:hypothetical protein
MVVWQSGYDDLEFDPVVRALYPQRLGWIHGFDDDPTALIDLAYAFVVRFSVYTRIFFYR